MTKQEFLKKYKVDNSRSDRFILKLFGYDHFTETEQLKPLVYAAYASLMGTQGELFEDSTMPISESDIESVTAQKKKFTKYWLVGWLVFSTLFGVLLFYNSNDAGEILLMGVLFIAIALLIQFSTSRNYNQILSSKEKQVIKGVITDKIRVEEEGSFFEISFREMILINSKVFYELKVGDIVLIEIFSDDHLIKRNVKKIGSLL